MFCSIMHEDLAALTDKIEREIEIAFGRPMVHLNESELKSYFAIAGTPGEICRAVFDRRKPSIVGAQLLADVAPPAARQTRWQILRNPQLRQFLVNLSRMLRVRDYAHATFRAYMRDILGFGIWLRARNIDLTPEVSENLAVDFMLERRAAGVSAQGLRGFRAALKLFCEANGCRREFLLIRTTKGRRGLPVVLNQEEIKRALDSVKNEKHWLMMSLMYSSGLRVSEVMKLRVRDIDTLKRTLIVRQGKGRKDRVTILSDKQTSLLEKYQGSKIGAAYLFESPHVKGKPLAVRSLQKIVQRAVSGAGVKSKASAHSFRHSFATHLLEGGTDIRHIQKLLGHEHIRTTTIYTQVATRKLAQIKSPL